MNSNIIKGNWKEIKGKIRQQWGRLTDDQVETIQGSYEQLEGLLQKTYGYQKDQADKAIQDFIDRNKWH